MPKKNRKKYICPKCHKKFKQKSHHDYHVYKRKRSCVVEITQNVQDCAESCRIFDKTTPSSTVSLECPRCHKSYSSQSSLTRHYRYSCPPRNFLPKTFDHQKQPSEGSDSIVLVNDKDIVHDIEKPQECIYPKYTQIYPTCTNHIPEIYPKKTRKNDKKIAKNLSKNECKFCSKTFKYKSGLYRHMKDRCKVKREEETIYKELLNEMHEMRNELMNLKGNITNTNANCHNTNTNSTNYNNIHNIQNNTVNNINIIPFGKENLYKLFDDNSVKKYFNRGYQSIKQLIQDTHFSKKFPELHNVFISNMRDLYALIFNGSGWMIMKKTEVIDQLFDDKQCFLIDNFKEMKHTLKPSVRKKFERFMMDDNINTIRKLKSEIKELLYNNRNMIIKK